MPTSHRGVEMHQIGRQIDVHDPVRCRGGRLEAYVHSLLASFLGVLGMRPGEMSLPKG